MSDLLFRLKGAGLSVPSNQESLAKRVHQRLKHGRSKPVRTTLLSAIDLDIAAGQRIGLIGHNGAGKSTLLRMLAGIYPATSGTIERNCKAYGLFSAGQGLHPKATGIENIYIKALSLGVSREEISQMLPGIVRFSGLGREVERPIENFSTGMRLRLAISISLSIEAEFYLLDEWIGAGDAQFHKKIQTRLNEVLEVSKGMVLASHNHTLIRRYCERSLVMSDGKIFFDGDTSEALDVLAGLERRASR